jgi:hypothetical protein
MGNIYDKYNEQPDEVDAEGNSPHMTNLKTNKESLEEELALYESGADGEFPDGFIECNFHLWTVQDALLAHKQEAILNEILAIEPIPTRSIRISIGCTDAGGNSMLKQIKSIISKGIEGE